MTNIKRTGRTERQKLAGRKPWPAKATPFIKELKATYKRFSAVVFICRDVGIDHQNYPLISQFLPLMRQSANVILDKSRAIQDCLPPNHKGNLPAWLRAAEDIDAVTGEIIEQLELIEPSLKKSEIQTVDGLLKLIQERLVRISEQVESVRSDSDTYRLQIWRPAVDEAVPDEWPIRKSGKK